MPETPGSLGNDARRWWALAVMLLAQLMIILDIVVVNVALPSAQRTLQIPPAHIQWVVTAYLLPFGGLLLLGGRIADYTGRRRAFLISTVGFALASATAGGAQSEAMLFASRALQGAFAAVMAPALLSMLTLGFPSGRDRNIAMSAYTVVSATGAAIGFVLGGILTEYLSWRWCLLINVPVSVLVLLGGSLLRESRSAGSQRYDLPGAVSATLGLLGVIYGISDAATHGWGGARTLAPIAAGIAILAAFVVWESRAPNPLLPLALLRSRSRVGGILAICCVFGPPAGLLLLTIVFLQGPQRESPLVAGLSFLPGPVCGALGAALVLPLIGRLAPRVLLLGVVAVQVVASIMLVRIHPGEAYLTDLLPALVLLGMGTASQYLIGNTIALADTPPDDAGVLGATINTFQQVSTALGASILATVAASVESHYLAAHGPRSLPQAVTHGDHRAFIVGAVMTAVLGIGGMLLMPGRGRAPAEAPAPGPVRPAPVSATPAATPRLIAWAITLGVVLAIAARGQRPP